MMSLLPARVLLALERVLLVALLAPVVVIAATAAIPALVLLPFFPGGTDRAVKLITAHTTYARTLLSSSRSDSATGTLINPRDRVQAKPAPRRIADASFPPASSHRSTPSTGPADTIPLTRTAEPSSHAAEPRVQ